MQLKDGDDFHDDDKDVNASGEAVRAVDESAGLSVDWLTASSPRPFVTLNEESGQAYPDAVALVDVENTSLPVPA